MSIKKIIYITNARLPTEKANGYQICKMCEAFADLGIRLTLYHPYRRQPKAFKNKTVFEYYGISKNFEVVTLPNFDIIAFEKYLPKKIFPVFVFLHSYIWAKYAVNKVEKEKADIYYTRSISVAYFLHKKKLPFILEIHTIPKGAQLKLLKKITKSKFLIRIAPLTSFMAKMLESIGFDKKKIVVLPDAVDLKLFENLPDKYECRRKLGLPKKANIIGYIGRFKAMDMEKGIYTLIEAMKYLLSKINGEPVYLLCVGGPMDMVPEYMEKAKKLGVAQERLLFYDRVPNYKVPFWIKACDIVTIPSPKNEYTSYFTSPMKVFEYMATGVPIVASDLPSLREVLEEEKDCLFFEPEKGKSLAEQLLKLLTDNTLKSTIVRNLSLKVNRYTWTERAKKILF